ncbi:N-acetylglucosamine kinase [Umezawaea beigongshangensis]|uniref:N-acetylglucosamine kinase n=1 Tax=Umezawaea beigongshangensis TaxID=2780383 RepID=UPI0018F181DB|nr:BadF/BadG/BcrA/BcrD ATPase family protein [Umezawaea beigongshangensis]
MALVVGVDAGGTSTRALVLDPDGGGRGTGLAGGGNPHSHPPAVAATRVGDALRMALEGLNPADVRAGVLGLAGAGALSDRGVRALFEQAWTGAGLRCPLVVVSDAEAAFAAGTTEPDGTVLVAGTGSIAARISGHSLEALAGGHGWLLGDEGSAFWLGREAVRRTLRLLDSSVPAEGLAAAVLEAAGVPVGTGRAARGALITAVNAVPPVTLASYAPLVTAHEDDPLAASIVADAARSLADLALSLRSAAERTPVVLVGGVMTTSVGAAVRSALAPHAEVRLATDPAAGAARLATLRP